MYIKQLLVRPHRNFPVVPQHIWALRVSMFDKMCSCVCVSACGIHPHMVYKAVGLNALNVLYYYFCQDMHAYYLSMNQHIMGSCGCMHSCVTLSTSSFGACIKFHNLKTCGYTLNICKHVKRKNNCGVTHNYVQ